jgi:hypothetical protein
LYALFLSQFMFVWACLTAYVKNILKKTLGVSRCQLDPDISDVGFLSGQRSCEYGLSFVYLCEANIAVGCLEAVFARQLIRARGKPRILVRSLLVVLAPRDYINVARTYIRNYLDRGDLFAAIGESDDDLERMAAVLRWTRKCVITIACPGANGNLTVTMWLKYVRGRIVKPYNSALGEQFRAHWDVMPSTLDEQGEPQHFEGLLSSDPTLPPPDLSTSLGALKISSDTDVASAASSSASRIAVDELPSSYSLPSSTPVSHAPSIKSTFTADTSVGSRPSDSLPQKDRHRIVFLSEQVSHHPPISCFWYESQPGANGSPKVQASGVDQISAKFTGTSVKVCAGSQNQGIFVRLPELGEEYQVGVLCLFSWLVSLLRIDSKVTHPTASITGILRGSPYVTISDYTYVTARTERGNTNLRAIINYHDEVRCRKCDRVSER